MDQITTDALMPRRALATRWDSSVGTLANMASEGRGPAFVKIGTRVFYRVADVLAYEAARRVATLDAA